MSDWLKWYVFDVDKAEEFGELDYEPIGYESIGTLRELFPNTVDYLMESGKSEAEVEEIIWEALDNCEKDYFYRDRKIVFDDPRKGNWLIAPYI